MRSIVAQDVVSASKFNRFHLLVFLWCFYQLVLMALILLCMV